MLRFHVLEAELMSGFSLKMKCLANKLENLAKSCWN